jgi:membrane fusion protein (multidrug efflux system)
MNLLNRSLLAGVISGVALAGCGDNTDPKGPPPVAVRVYTVAEGHADYMDRYPAVVTALNQVDLRPEVSGYITEIFFKDGQHVRRGMKLYAIDEQQYRAAFDQATANLNVAKANFAKARQDADRYNELAKQDAVARQTLEHAQEDLEAARMQVEASGAAVKSAATNLRYALIEAPFDGTVGISQVKVGSTVTTGQTLLNTISSDDPMGVDCSVDQKEIGRFNAMLKQTPGQADSTFTILLPDGAVYPFTGRLSMLDRAVDPLTGTIRVRVVFPNPQNLLRPGLTCDLRVQTSSPSNTLLLPSKATLEQMGEYFVFVVSGDKAMQRRVALGMRINDMVVVKSGLRAGEQVVVDGVQKLRDNATVTVASPRAQPLTAAKQG